MLLLLRVGRWDEGAREGCVCAEPVALVMLLVRKAMPGKAVVASREVAVVCGSGVWVALAWLLKHPSKIIPVLGTGNLDRIRGAAGALELKLSRDQWFRIWTASAGQEVP